MVSIGLQIFLNNCGTKLYVLTSVLSDDLLHNKCVFNNPNIIPFLAFFLVLYYVTSVILVFVVPFLILTLTPINKYCFVPHIYMKAASFIIQN
jgi:hypothetical protein